MWIRGERLWLGENGDAFAARDVTVRRGLVTRQQATGYAKDKKIFD